MVVCSHWRSSRVPLRLELLKIEGTNFISVCSAAAYKLCIHVFTVSLDASRCAIHSGCHVHTLSKQYLEEGRGVVPRTATHIPPAVVAHTHACRINAFTSILYT